MSTETLTETTIKLVHEEVQTPVNTKVEASSTWRETVEDADLLTCRIYMNMSMVGKTLPDLFHSAMKYAKTAEAYVSAGREFYASLAKPCVQSPYLAGDQNFAQFLTSMSNNLTEVHEMTIDLIKNLNNHLIACEYRIEQEYKQAQEDFISYDSQVAKTHQAIVKQRKADRKRKDTTEHSPATIEMEKKYCQERFDGLSTAIQNEQCLFYELGFMIKGYVDICREYHEKSEKLLRGNFTIRSVKCKYDFSNRGDEYQEAAKILREYSQTLPALENLDSSTEKRLQRVDESNLSSSQKSFASSFFKGVKRTPCSFLRNYASLGESTVKKEIEDSGFISPRSVDPSIYDDESQTTPFVYNIRSRASSTSSTLPDRMSMIASESTDGIVNENVPRAARSFITAAKRKDFMTSEEAKSHRSGLWGIISGIGFKKTKKKGEISGSSSEVSTPESVDKISSAEVSAAPSRTVSVSEDRASQEEFSETSSLDVDASSAAQIMIKESEMKQIFTEEATEIVSSSVDSEPSEAALSVSEANNMSDGVVVAESTEAVVKHDAKAEKKKVLASKKVVAIRSQEKEKGEEDRAPLADIQALCAISSLSKYEFSSQLQTEDNWFFSEFGMAGTSIKFVTPLLFNEVPLGFIKRIQIAA